MGAPRVRLAGWSPRWASLLLGAVAVSLSCGGGENGSTAVAPTIPRPAPRQLTGLEVVAERTAVRVGQVLGPLVAYGRYDDGTTGTVGAAWTSSHPGVLEVAEDGAVAGISVGVAEVSASFEGLTDALDFAVDEPTPRATRDQPDDFDGPQIHAVYALPSDIDDEKLDRYGDIARSFEAMQDWLSEEIGYRLRLDTHDGELDVTYLRLHFTPLEGDGTSTDLIHALDEAVRDGIGHSGQKIYAIYYAGRNAGQCGTANLAGPNAAVYVHREGCSSTLPGAKPGVVSTYEAVMVHEILHAIGAVPDCAPNRGASVHVQDSPEDLMYAGAERGTRSEEALIDFGRDDYFGHGRADCLDTANSRFWELVGPGRPALRAPRSERIDIPAADWPLRCELH